MKDAFLFLQSFQDMISYSNAKINVGLYVTEKRSDGYHSIESLFFPIGYYDAIELIPAKQNGISIYGLPVPGSLSDNSCLKALELMQRTFGISTNYHIYLMKNIPTGAGLGGGSGNATTVLKMVNEREQLHLSDEELEQLASQLGSDTMFFVKNKGQFVTGRGETISNCALDLTDIKVVLMIPPLHQSTKEAYQDITVQPAPIDLQHVELSHLLNQSIEVVNVFQDGFMNKFPFCYEIENQLKHSGAFYYSMSGSGSSFYGLFTPNQEIPKSLAQFSKENHITYKETKIL